MFFEHRHHRYRHSHRHYQKDCRKQETIWWYTITEHKPRKRQNNSTKITTFTTINSIFPIRNSTKHFNCVLYCYLKDNHFASKKTSVYKSVHLYNTLGALCYKSTPGEKKVSLIELNTITSIFNLTKYINGIFTRVQVNCSMTFHLPYSISSSILKKTPLL